MTPEAHGPDTSHWNTYTGEPFGAWPLHSLKCSEGRQSGDVTFRERWELLHLQGGTKYRGAYHWLRSDATIRDQANNLLVRVGSAGGIGRGDFIQLDWETTPNIPVPTSLMAAEFADRVNQAIGRECVITYTGSWLPDSPLDSDTRREFLEWRDENPTAPLWLAYYDTSQFGGWAAVDRWDVDVWQFTSNYKHPAIYTPILNSAGAEIGRRGFDMNHVLRFDVLDRLTDQVPAPEPEPTPEPIPEPAPDPGPVIPPEDDMTLYAARDANGTIWIGDGVKRRPIPGPDVYAAYVFRSGVGSGPKVLDTGGHVAPGDPAQLKIETPAVIETLGEHD